MSCFQLIESEKTAGGNVRRMCSLLQVSRTSFYRWKSGKQSKRAAQDARLGAKIEAISRKHKGRYGSRRVHFELTKKGERLSRKRVLRLMRELGVMPKPKRRYRVTTRASKRAPVADNVLNRDFTATAPDQKWVGDITFVPTAEGWLYLAVVLDLFSRRVVGWSMDSVIDQELVLSAFRMAASRREVREDAIFHSDRGSQYTSKRFQKLLASHAVTPSMSRAANCWDNAVAESFFATLEKELLVSQPFDTRQHARDVLFEYIEIYYNRERRHSSLGYLTPVEAEQAWSDEQTE